MISPEPQALQEQVRDLYRQGTPWLPAGAGSRLHWGPPVAPESLVLSCRRLNRILEHNPGDFTVSVEAGTPLAELQACLASQNQWLPLDWPCSSGPGGEASGSIEASGSVGGLVARGLAGGYRQRYLGVRDQLIGIGLIRSDGVFAHAGGKVVKNVAGYDLMRLFTGSWGSLGLITELTLRTLPLPPQRRGLWLAGSLAELDALSRWLLASSLSPERLDWWSAPLVEQAPIEAPPSPQPRLLLSLASV
ncbi:MAG: FAD-binding oxidoreductase, partial [Prochlorococcaceae cyanobacterium]